MNPNMQGKMEGKNPLAPPLPPQHARSQLVLSVQDTGFSVRTLGTIRALTPNVRCAGLFVRADVSAGPTLTTGTIWT